MDIDILQFCDLVMVDTETYWETPRPDKPDGKLALPPPPPLLSDDVGQRSIGGIPTCFCKRCTTLNNVKKKARFANYANINPMTTKELTPHQYFLCDRSVYGFVMKVRSWRESEFSY